jgi:hypothetical protein
MLLMTIHLCETLSRYAPAAFAVWPSGSAHHDARQRRHDLDHAPHFAIRITTGSWGVVHQKCNERLYDDVRHVVRLDRVFVCGDDSIKRTNDRADDVGKAENVCDWKRWFCIHSALSTAAFADPSESWSGHSFGDQ